MLPAKIFFHIVCLCVSTFSMLMCSCVRSCVHVFMCSLCSCVCLYCISEQLYICPIVYCLSTVLPVCLSVNTTLFFSNWHCSRHTVCLSDRPSVCPFICTVVCTVYMLDVFESIKIFLISEEVIYDVIVKSKNLHRFF